MSPRRTRRGTIRENISEISTDNNLKSSKKLRSTCRIIINQKTKSSEEDNDNTVDANSSFDNINSFVNDTSSNTRKRQRKVEDVAINLDNSLSAITEELKTKSRSRKKNLKTPKSTKKTKTKKSQIVDVNLLISEDESSDTKSQKDEKQLPYIISNLISEDEEIPEPTSRKRLKSDNKNSYLLYKECKTPEKFQRVSNSQVLTPETEITPKSSPINVSLTPHRSTKTPKKSPVNLGSPKTHAHDSFSLLNVQRKLSIVESPSSDNSNSSLQQSNSSNFDNFSFENTNKSGKSSKSVLKSNKKKSISPLLKVRPQFSKSPKIVFRTPKSKSSKSKKTSKKSLSSTLKKLSVSPIKSKKSSSANTSLKSEKTPPTSSSKSKKRKKDDSILESEKSSVTFEELNKSEKSSKSTKSSKTNSSLKSKKSTKAHSPLKSITSPKNDSQLKSEDLLNTGSKKSKKSTSKTTPVKPKISLSPSKSKSSSKITPVISKKMPKIILSSKKSKSVSPSKSKKSPKSVSSSKSRNSRNVSPSKSKKSPNATSSPKLKKSPNVISSPKSEKTLSVNKSINSNKLSKNSCISPRVILKKLSSPQLNNSILHAKENQPTINLVPVDHIQLSAKSKYLTVSNDNNKHSKFTKKQSESKSAKFIKNKTDTVRFSIGTNSTSNINTPSDILEKKLLNLKPTNTSTPREKIKPAFSLESNKKNTASKRSSTSVKLNGSSTPKPKAIKRLNNQSTVKIQQPLVEDESEPSLNDSSLMHMSDFDSDNSEKDNTFEINKSNLDKRKSLQDLNVSQKSNEINNTFEIKKNSSNSTKVKSIKDDTYELENSKIDIKTKSNKRTLNQHEVDICEEPESKKSCRVHFANFSFVNQVQSTAKSRIGTPGNTNQQRKTSASISKTKTPTDESFVNNVKNRRVTSVSKLQVKTPVNTTNKRRSNSLSDTTLRSRKSNHEAQVASVNRLSRPKLMLSSEKKLGIKTPVTRKIPNFAEIHQKNFEKMESLYDLKKRVEKRHISLNTATPGSKRTTVMKHQSGSSKIAPSESTNGVYNKYGFKLRKNDAVNIISNKQTGNVESREKKREDARNILKGVRMNRRFELQMKSRIKNL